MTQFKLGDTRIKRRYIPLTRKIMRLPFIISKNYGARLTFRLDLMRRKLFTQYLGIYISERVIEYPWVLKNLDSKNIQKKVLDVGCCDSFLSYELIARGYDTSAIDVRSYPEKHPDLKFYQTDLLNLPFPDNFFNQIVAVSTIEHIGLGFYGDPEQDSGDFVAMQELRRVLNKSGKILVTLPFAGKYTLTPMLRIYDEERLSKLCEGLIVEKEEVYIPYRKGRRVRWIIGSKKDAEDISSPESDSAIACLILRREGYK